MTTAGEGVRWSLCHKADILACLDVESVKRNDNIKSQFYKEKKKKKKEEKMSVVPALTDPLP